MQKYQDEHIWCREQTETNQTTKRPRAQEVEIRLNVYKSEFRETYSNSSVQPAIGLLYIPTQK